jgi:exodeoxyribonuclease V alpha subunit
MTTFYSGCVKRILFSSKADSFYIMNLVLDGTGQSVTVKGTVPLDLQVGSWFGFEASWVNDQKYGRQLQITRAPHLEPVWTHEAACNMLLASGVGWHTIQALSAYFGEDLIDALSDPDRLVKTPGVQPHAAAHVADRWRSVNATFKVLEILTDAGLPPDIIKKIRAHFGDDTEVILTQDPWALTQVPGVKFTHANLLAQRMGILNPQAQARGALKTAVQNSKGFGHTYLQIAEVFAGAIQLVHTLQPPDMVPIMLELHRDGVIRMDKKTRPGTVAVYDFDTYFMEEQAAHLLAQRKLLATVSARCQDGIKSVGPQTSAIAQSGAPYAAVAWAAIQEWGSQSHITLSDDQQRGIHNALTAPVSILTGLPGTGKTTSLRAAVRILQDAGVPFLLCAPTGIAAKNLADRTGAEASTIHRAFSARLVGDTKTRERTYFGVVGASEGLTDTDSDSAWGYDPSNPYPAEVVIVDEASMVDLHLLYRLLSCTAPQTRIVFVGDAAQLPSVGPGNVLRDLISADLFPTVKLDQIFRQQDTSGIVYAAHSIHRGDIPDMTTDFRLVHRTSEDEILKDILAIAQRWHEADVNYQILSPRHKGTVGVTNLNESLRALLNPASPGKAEASVGGRTLREGDRVMIIRNDYEKGVFNGDLGTVSEVDKSLKEIQVLISGDTPLLITLPLAAASNYLSLAYAVTVHKSQGMEYDRVVMPLIDNFHHQLQRNLLYTAITRAKKQVVLLGQPTALAKAVYNANEDERQTLLKERLFSAHHEHSPA